jgi:dTDP-4-amino-4,6-dideoxy-D-galactose acyltransferase
MIATDPAEPPGIVLPWDTEFFGFRVGRLSSPRLTTASLNSALKWAKAERLRCAYFFADGECPSTLSLACEGGFKFVDVRMELSLAAGPMPALPPEAMFRPAAARDLPAIAALSRIAHLDTRFFKDENFPAAKAAELYVEWIHRDFKLHRVFTVPLTHEDIAGYITCEYDRTTKVGRIGLIAVTATRRRRGLGRALVAGALQWFWDSGCEEVRVVTQASNVAAQRAYQSLGFRTVNACATFHRWFQSP